MLMSKTARINCKFVYNSALNGYGTAQDAADRAKKIQDRPGAHGIQVEIQKSAGGHEVTITWTEALQL